MPSIRTYIVIISGMALVAIVIGVGILLRSLPAFWEPVVWVSAIILVITALIAARIEYKRHK